MKKFLPWIRLYTGAVDNEKLRLLSFEDRWHFMALLCCKGQGVLEDTGPLLARKVAVKLGLDVRTLEEVARRLAEVALIDPNTFQPLGWDARQFICDSDPTAAERQRRCRAKQRGAGDNGNHGQPGDVPVTRDVTRDATGDVTIGNGSVTRVETETETEGETEKKKSMSRLRSTSQDIEQVFAYWQEVMRSPRSKLDDKRRKLIKRALDLGYSGDELRTAIRGCSRSAWHMGQNDRGAVYNGLDLILRDASKIDAFIAADANPPRATAGGNYVADRNAAAIAEFLGNGPTNGGDPMTIDMEAP